MIFIYDKLAFNENNMVFIRLDEFSIASEISLKNKSSFGRGLKKFEY